MKIQGNKTRNETFQNISKKWIRHEFKLFTHICYKCKIKPIEHECKPDFI